jgi:hypothetical protein
VHDNTLASGSSVMMLSGEEHDSANNSHQSPGLNTAEGSWADDSSVLNKLTEVSADKASSLDAIATTTLSARCNGEAKSGACGMLSLPESRHNKKGDTEVGGVISGNDKCAKGGKMEAWLSIPLSTRL